MRIHSLKRLISMACIASSISTVAWADAANAQVYGSTSTNLAAAGPDNLWGTVTVRAPLGRYLAQGQRARASAAANPRLQALVAPARGLGRAQQIAFVQDAVHRQIRWMSDATEWGQHDYWASAAETLAHGAGDTEDRAIVKMQALIALGFGPNELFLTLGKDTVGGPMPLLVVRTMPGRYVTLDDLGGAPIPAEKRLSFTPMMSVGINGSWLHGYRVAERGSGGR